jgi:hypothetical protein
MKRNQVNSILINQTKRRNTVFAYICVIINAMKGTLNWSIPDGNEKMEVTYEI